jgi:hypothetical protein
MNDSDERNNKLCYTIIRSHASQEDFRSENGERLDFARVSSGSRPDRKSTTWITPVATLGLRMSCSENGRKFRLECFERPDDKLHAAVPTEQTDFALDGLEKT